MTQSRFPFWRTRPAGLAKSSDWPNLTDAVAVLVFAPLFGACVIAPLLLALVAFSGLAFTSQGSANLFAGLPTFPLLSPIVTWAILRVAMPIGAYLAHIRFAGWGVAT